MTDIVLTQLEPTSDVFEQLHDWQTVAIHHDFEAVVPRAVFIFCPQIPQIEARDYENIRYLRHIRCEIFDSSTNINSLDSREGIDA